MKTKFLSFALLATFTLSVGAQSDYSIYLNKVTEKLGEGDCSSARKFYNVYKDLSGDAISSLEVLISECEDQPHANKKYALNDKILVDDRYYRVAYVEEDGIHGFAIYDLGAGPLYDDLLNNRKVPTRSEMELIYPNRKKLNVLENVDYWTIDRQDAGYYFVCCMKAKKINYSRFKHYKESCARMLIHRF